MTSYSKCMEKVTTTKYRTCLFPSVCTHTLLHSKMDEITETPMAEKYADNNTRDVSDIWADAIRDYRGVSGKELKDRFAQFNGVEAMIRFGGQEMDKFHKFRHDSGKVDKLRGLFSDTMWLIEAGTQQAVAAAVPVFPPAAAIGTALTYMLSVSTRD